VEGLVPDKESRNRAHPQHTGQAALWGTALSNLFRKVSRKENYNKLTMN
jgi:hypothetical protein